MKELAGLWLEHAQIAGIGSEVAVGIKRAWARPQEELARKLVLTLIG